MLIAVIVRTVFVEQHWPPEAAYMFTICRMDALALGAAAAAAVRTPRIFNAARAKPVNIAIVAIGMLLITALTSHLFAAYDVGSQTIGYTLLAAGFALIVLLTALPTKGWIATVFRWLSATPLRLIGRYSFAMYIFHLPLHVFVGAPLLHSLGVKNTPKVALLYLIVIMLASFVAGALSYHLFERHFLRLKRWFVPARAEYA